MEYAYHHDWSLARRCFGDHSILAVDFVELGKYTQTVYVASGR